jgi:hypothetical protein
MGNMGIRRSLTFIKNSTHTFDDNFTTQFGKDHREIVTGFETFLQQDPSQRMSIIS